MKTVHNSRFAKAGVLCFYESEVLNSSLVHLITFSAKNPHHSPSPETLASSLTDERKIIQFFTDFSPEQTIRHLVDNILGRKYNFYSNRD